MIGWVCGPMGSSMPLADRAVAGPPDADDAAVLDADVGLDHAEHRVHDDDPGDDRIELGRRRPALGGPRPEGLGVAPDRLVAGRLAVLADADPQVGIAEADRVADGRAVAGQPFGGGQPAHRSLTAPGPG